MFRHFSAALLATAAAAASGKPNILLILTDDQDIELGGLTPMNKTRQLLGEEGAVGEAFYVQTPICCPSRTELFSGRQYHNVLAPDLSKCMHVDSMLYIFQHAASIGTLMQSAGYRTAAFGKVINGQKKSFQLNKPIVDGYDWISAPTDEGDFFAGEFFNKVDNGTMWIESLGDDSQRTTEWYQTSQIGNRSLQFIRDSVQMGKPFFAFLGPHAPHFSADAPPWAQTLFEDLDAPHTPAYNTSIGQMDKNLHISQNPPVSAEMEKWINRHFRDRWRSIVGVDDMIGLIVDELKELNVLDNTYIFFTSDHGYKLGDWRLGCSKQHPFETDVHVPFMVRGPGIAPGTRIKALGSNIDITPTIIDIAGLPPHAEHDGHSLLPMLLSTEGTAERLTMESSWRKSLLIEYIAAGTYYNNHAPIWVSGPGEKPGTPVVYGAGPLSAPNTSITEPECAKTEGEGKCYFVDSELSNNWIAMRVRNETHNYIYAETYGQAAMQATTADGSGIGMYKCLEGDYCHHELYDYGPITSDYPNFPVMTVERWNIHNVYKSTSESMRAAMQAELQHAYCSTRKLAQDRMECDSRLSERTLVL